MDVEKTLEDIGLCKNEVKVYLALSKMGEANANKIADISKVHRTNVYDSLDKLIEKGLVSYMHKENVKLFRITDPQQLLLLMEERKKEVQKIIPQLKLGEKLTPVESYAEVVEGVKAFCNILENFLKYKEDILCYGIPKEAPELMKYFISGFHQRRAAKKIVMNHIYNFNAQERIKTLNTIPYAQARFLTHEYDSKVSTNVCGDEVVFAIWNEKVICIRVKNKDVADVYKKYFYVLWEKAAVK
jgi:sugar-specific transcriptional regulator TrmB